MLSLLTSDLVKLISSNCSTKVLFTNLCNLAYFFFDYSSTRYSSNDSQTFASWILSELVHVKILAISEFFSTKLVIFLLTGEDNDQTIFCFICWYTDQYPFGQVDEHFGVL